MILQLKKKQVAIGSALLLCCILMIGYIIPRNNFALEIGFFALGIFGFFLLNKLEDVTLFFKIGLVLRLVLIVSTPLLSDDYFRFLWDGYLTCEGINPIDYKPFELSTVFENAKFANTLYEGIHSKTTYSFYPPVNQWIFYLSALPGSLFGGILTLRLFIIGFEIGTFLILQKILTRFRIPSWKLNLYWLNPLVILELTGNLHTEGVFVFFLLTGLLSLCRLQDFKGGILLGLAFCSRLVGLLFLPLLLLKGGKHRWHKNIIGALLVLFFSFLPFILNANPIRFYDNLNSYFKEFEFPNSILKILSLLGFHMKEYNGFQIVGLLLNLLIGVVIFYLNWIYRFRNRKVLFTGLTLVSSIFLFFTTAMSPWCIVIPLSLSIFTNLTFPLVWSIIAYLSYSFYDSNLNVIFKSTIIVFEYATVLFFAIRDYKRLRPV